MPFTKNLLFQKGMACLQSMANKDVKFASLSEHGTVSQTSRLLFSFQHSMEVLPRDPYSRAQVYYGSSFSSHLCPRPLVDQISFPLQYTYPENSAVTSPASARYS